MLCDFGLSRTLPDSVVGKHNGQSKKVRDSVINKLPSTTPKDELNFEIHHKVLKVKKLDKNKRHSLSPHVQTRSYRAPEVILLK